MASCSSIKLFSLPAAGVLHYDNTGYEGDRFPRISWSRQFGQKSGSVCSREMAGTAILGRLASMAQPSQGGCIGTRRFTCPARMVRQAHPRIRYGAGYERGEGRPAHHEQAGDRDPPLSPLTPCFRRGQALSQVVGRERRNARDCPLAWFDKLTTSGGRAAPSP